MAHKEPPEWWLKAWNDAIGSSDQQLYAACAESCRQGYSHYGRLIPYYDAWLKGEKDSAPNRTHTPHPDNPYPPGTLGHELFEKDEARKRENARELSKEVAKQLYPEGSHPYKVESDKQSKFPEYRKVMEDWKQSLKQRYKQEAKLKRIASDVKKALEIAVERGMVEKPWDFWRYDPSTDCIYTSHKSNYGAWETVIPMRILIDAPPKPRKQLKLTPEQLATFDNED